jgi:hypothetical protein
MSNDQAAHVNCPGCGKPIDPDREGWVNIVPNEYVNRLNEDDIPRVPWHYSCWEKDRMRRTVDIGY